jgi:hypothetical protein
MSASPPEPVADRRTTARQRSLWGAKIVINNNSSMIDCLVRDLSPQGARLSVATQIGIPDRFDLRIDRSGARYPAKVAWRSRNQIGFRFLNNILD